MSLIEIIAIAFSLSLDCFAVSISSGGTMKFFNLKNLIKLAFSFGFFQSIMPIIGYLLGNQTIKYVEPYAHLVAFGLLTGIGVKMIYESSKLDELTCHKKKCPFDIKTLFILSIATSIDALACGFTISILKTSLLIPVITIGIFAFIMSILGITIGYKGKNFFGEKMETIAGIILITIGIKIIFLHK